MIASRRLALITTWTAIVIVAGLSGGCAQTAAEGLLDQAKHTLENQYAQELENIAMFNVIPEGLPQYIRINRGTVDARPERGWSLGTDTWIAGGLRTGIVWEISAVTDPGDLQRLRLMFQWVTRHIEFDELQRLWNEIQDQPEFSADAKQRFDDQGRPVLRPAPLPITDKLTRDWYTTDARQAVEAIKPGEFRNVKVWVKDVSGAVMFTLAVQRAMPNTRPPLALPMPGR